MSDQPFLKCPCQNCGGPIEFPAAGVGLKVECPHCGQKTVLSGATPRGTDPMVAAQPPQPIPQPAAAATSPPRPFSTLLVLLLLLAAGAIAGGGFWYFKIRPGSAKEGSSGLKKVSPPGSGGATNDASPEPTPAPAPETPKSLDDLKPSAVTLEKAKSGNLVHAVGTVKNDSDHQRFGVRVEIELIDAMGRPAGKITDYAQVIEPRAEWRFRALVLDAKAVSGSVAGIKEDN